MTTDDQYLLLKKVYENSEQYAAMHESVKVLSRDMERLVRSFERLHEKTETILSGCAYHRADTKAARSIGEEALKEMRTHKQNHLTWYGIVVGIIALFNLDWLMALKRLVWPGISK